jgi:hypothetical protein
MVSVWAGIIEPDDSEVIVILLVNVSTVTVGEGLIPVPDALIEVIDDGSIIVDGKVS